MRNSSANPQNHKLKIGKGIIFMFCISSGSTSNSMSTFHISSSSSLSLSQHTRCPIKCLKKINNIFLQCNGEILVKAEGLFYLFII